MSDFTPEMISSLYKCQTDALFFVEKALGYDILSEKETNEFLDMATDPGPVIQNNSMRLTAAYLVWYMTYKPGKVILIGTSNHKEAMEISLMIKDYHDNIPSWLKSPCTSANHNGMTFDNGSKFHAQAITDTLGRGIMISKLYLHNFDKLSKYDKQSLWLSDELKSYVRF